MNSHKRCSLKFIEIHLNLIQFLVKMQITHPEIKYYTTDNGACGLFADAEKLPFECFTKKLMHLRLYIIFV